jgi:shikimate kinase/shikimate kinase/3-dehydroquinate synthase
MKSGKNIVFLGMMGSGKTSIGFLLSKKLKLDFYDVDIYIEKKLNMKISEIFKNKGEEFFRKEEERVTLNILKKKKGIIALGGGGFLNKNIRDEVLKNHLSFWLKLDSDILLDRIKNSSKRPLTINASNNELKNMMKKRSKYYSQALFKINCNNQTKKEIINKILDNYESN